MCEYRKLKSLKFLYEINEHGDIRNVKSKKKVKGYVEKNGYIRVKFENKCLGGVIRKGVHQLIAEAFIPNPNNLPEINHIDCNRQNNHVSNLEWVTHSQNMKHAYVMNNETRRPLRKHSEETRKVVTNGSQVFPSISHAARWLTENRLIKTYRAAIGGISAVCRGKRNTLGGYVWKYV